MKQVLLVRSAPWPHLERLLAAPPFESPPPWDLLDSAEGIARARGWPGIREVVVRRDAHFGPLGRDVAEVRGRSYDRLLVLAPLDGDLRTNVRFFALAAAGGRARRILPDGMLLPLRAFSALFAEALRGLLFLLLTPVAAIWHLCLFLRVLARACAPPDPAAPRIGLPSPRAATRDISICVVTWNHKKEIGPLLESLPAAMEGTDAEVIVSDNGSTDGTIERVRADACVRLLENGRNLGYAAAFHRALSWAAGRYVVAANADIVLAPGVLRTICSYLDAHPEVGALGPRLVSPDGRAQHGFQVRRFPTPLALAAESTFWRRFISPRVLREYRMTDFDPSAPTEVDQPAGAFLVVRREVLETVGGMDEGFFLLFEDVDWCRRIRKAGWKIVHLPSAEIVHAGSTSFSRSRSGFPLLYHRSMERYFALHEPPVRRIALDLLMGSAAILGGCDRIASLPAMPGHGPALRDGLRSAWAVYRIHTGLDYGSSSQAKNPAAPEMSR